VAEVTDNADSADDGGASLATDVPLASAVRCPACETTVLPVTGWCSYCMEPLPIDGLSSDASTLAAWDFEDFETELPGEMPSEMPSAQVIVGPWPDRPNGLTYASWQQRAIAALVDTAVFLPAAIAMVFSPMVSVVLLVAAVAFTAWQVCRLQGRTGQTIGKNRVGIFVVEEASLAPIGVRRSALRQLAHGIDAALFGLGYLWPLWDAKHQTFADQLFSTVVVSG
jgi:uncharacterized RDD family membrane protein YckC